MCVCVYDKHTPSYRPRYRHRSTKQRKVSPEFARTPKRRVRFIATERYYNIFVMPTFICRSSRSQSCSLSCGRTSQTGGWIFPANGTELLVQHIRAFIWHTAAAHRNHSTLSTNTSGPRRSTTQSATHGQHATTDANDRNVLKVSHRGVVLAVLNVVCVSVCVSCKFVCFRCARVARAVRVERVTKLSRAHRASARCVNDCAFECARVREVRSLCARLSGRMHV